MSVVDLTSLGDFITAPNSFMSSSHSFIPSIYRYYSEYPIRSVSNTPESMDRMNPLIADSMLNSSSTLSNNHLHMRTTSNPFDVLYDSTSRIRSPPVNRFTPPNITPPKLATPLRISPNHGSNNTRISPPTSGTSQAITTGAAPIVTIINQPIKRSGSRVSRTSNTASIRRRNTARSRSNHVPLHRLENSELEKPRRRRRVRFLFPVKRKTSLKYAAVARQVPNFHTQDQLLDFFAKSNAAQLSAEFAPKRMQFFEYDSLIRVNPKLESKYHFTGPPNIKKPMPLHHSPMQLPISAPLHPRHQSTVSLRDIVYLKYKNAVFANKYATIPKFAELFPHNLHLLTKAEVSHINKKLLFEVLLRRTVAAKIEYRLRQSLVNRKSMMASISSVNSSTSSSSGSHFHRQLEHHHSSHLPQLYKDVNPSSSDESVNTEELMQQNASLFSEQLLPSPQISYASNFFGSIYKDRSKPPSSVYSSPKSKHSTSYINDFNKTYYNKYQDHVSQTLFNSNVYQLRPIPRSATTLSTSDNSHRETTEIMASSSSDKSNLASSLPRKSQSTEHTSIIQNLDDLSSELSSFMEKKDIQKEAQKVHQPEVEIKSMKGSILMMGSDWGSGSVTSTPTTAKNLGPIHELAQTFDTIDGHLATPTPPLARRNSGHSSLPSY